MPKYRRERDVIKEATDGGVLDAATLMNMLSHRFPSSSPSARVDVRPLAPPPYRLPRRRTSTQTGLSPTSSQPWKAAPSASKTSTVASERLLS